MDVALLALILLGASTVIGVGAFEARDRRRRQATWQTVRLRFGRDVSSEAVGALLDRLAGLHQAASVCLDVEADHREIAHYLSSDRATIETLRGSFRALLPGVRLEPAGERRPSEYRFGQVIRLRGRLGVLRRDKDAETSAALLAAMQPLGKNEQLLLRWLVRPGRPEPLLPLKEGETRPAEHTRLLRLKNEGSILRARVIVAAAAGHPKRAEHLLGRMASVLRSRSTAYGYLRGGLRRGAQLARLLNQRHARFADRYAVAELAPLIGWPIGAPVLPGLSLGTSPLLMPSRRLPTSGRVLGDATWPGEQRPVAQPVVGALSHSLIAGPTGVGKSTLLTHLIAADIEAGRGVVLIDGKGDTAKAVLARVPLERQGDVVVLDCAQTGPQPGLKLFGGDDSELAADVVLGVLSDLFRDAWGPLSERYLRAGLVATAHDPEGTLADVPFVFADPVYRRQLVGRVRDPLTKATLASFEAMSAAERAQQLAAPLNKLGTLLGRPIVRTVLGQSEPRLDFRRVLRERQIVIVNLSPARVGAPAARLIGALSVFALFQAVQARSMLSERARKPFLVCIDEPRALGELHMPLDSLLEQARGLGVGVTLAPQSMTQLPKSIREAALTNAATRVIFRQHADDARLLARDLPNVTPEELGDLAAYEAVTRIGLGPGDVAPPVTIKTRPAVRALHEPSALQAVSAERWGISLDEVDDALDNRHRAQPETPVGRRRRAS